MINPSYQVVPNIVPTIVSSIQKENIFGVQFHPEKSHKNGLLLLKNFINHVSLGMVIKCKGKINRKLND